MLSLPKHGTFGYLIREERLCHEIGLREMARKLSISPIHLSKLERNGLKPSQELVKAIAEIIHRDGEELWYRFFEPCL